MRLLPWATEDGRPCYLDPGGNGSSFMSHLADGIEAVQLGMGSDLLEHVRGFLSGDEPPETGWRHVVTALSSALEDALRVAESRGERLPELDDVDQEAARAAQAVVKRAFIAPRTTAGAAPIGDRK